jgi:carboxyl-terminal processing protease
MQKIASIIMNKNFLTIIIVLTALSLFITFNSQGKSDKEEDPKQKQSKVLKNVGILIKDGHFHPQPIDDVFSKKVLTKFTEELDDQKDILLQSDINAFKKFSLIIDNEILGEAELTSFYEINSVYLKRLKEVSELYAPILEKPFDFSASEKIQMNPEKLNFPKNERDRYEIWKSRLKYAVLSKYVDKLEDRETNKTKKDFIYQADSTLERISREQIKKQMDRYFTTKKNRETLDENFSTFINCITGLNDPHSNYFPPVDLRSFNESMSGSFFGIGAQLKEDDGKIKITSLVPGGPAWKSGELKENDEIIMVAQGDKEPVDVTGYSVADAVKLIRGSEKGSEVRLTVKRIDGNIKVISILRDKVNTEETFAKSAIINGNKKIGYIYLPEFYADFEKANGVRCATDVAKELEKLKAENIQGLIIDLRGNGGGSLYDVVQMAGLFIPNGPICQVKGKEDKPNVLSDKDNKVQYDGPLAVMVDGTSASASEIFAAAIQDYKRGIIIGSQSTYGKGTVQRNISLNDEAFNNIFAQNNTSDLGAVKLTIQKFYRINGGATQKKGVIPDVVLPDRYDYLKYREKDNASALEWDEIPKAKYDEWTSNISLNQFVLSENQAVAKNNTFNLIKSNVSWLAKYNDKEYSLNLNQYRQDQKELKKIISSLDSLNKVAAPLSLTNVSSDTAYINSNKDKIEKNKQWLKVRNTDVYLNESIKILSDFIQQNNKASAKLN